MWEIEVSRMRLVTRLEVVIRWRRLGEITGRGRFEVEVWGSTAVCRLVCMEGIVDVD